VDHLRAIEAYTRLVEVGSFTAVAEELRVKQSTVSKWIAALEEELGVRLVDRTPRSLRVTDVGQAFYERSRRLVDEWGEAVAEAQSTAPEPSGRIRMSLPVVFGQRFVVPQLARYLRRYPRLQVELVFSDRYVRLVEEGFDLAIRVGLQVDSTLRSHALGESRRRLVASPGYLRARGTPRTPKDLERHECLLHSDSGGTAIWSFTKGERTQRASVRGRIVANNSEATLALARSGLGLCVLASWLVDADVRAKRLVPLLEDYALPPAPVRALTPPGRYVPSRVRKLIEFLREGLGASVG
jgi:DNA-binding transcriptional LysR family regulator